MVRALPLPPADARERGFTLIEALVVLAVVGLVAGIAYPAIERSRDALALRHARGQLAAAVGAARAGATRTDAAVALTVANRGAALAAGADKPVPLDEDGRIGVRMVPAQIWFHPDGSASGGRIRLIATQGPTDYVVEPDTGLFREARPGDA
ncbi:MULTISPECIES: prepilin-type N-terminal cleavage/methylation domain-containing protein [Novosphingobium]|uniref:prepilin-type N-terminal cleavage/methylation domain-containing protein n=1 Tax=Novosphingobium TaxID=165696 RepID=UPI001CD26D18|nr:prepilin-type N-terminal cleavage/methylation domain-containing protein [Novosphingobium percolationis]